MKKSNLYIERIYADYPISCWALDDDVSYRQLLNNSYLMWQITGGDWEFTTNPILPAIENSIFKKIIINNIATLKYSDINSIVLDPSINDMVFSAFVYHNPQTIEKYEIGIISNSIEYFSEFTFSDNGWKNIYDVFPINLINSTSELYIKIYAKNNVGAHIYFNAPSLGQDCEEFISYSSGYNAQTVVDEYGKNIENNGTYISDQYGSFFVKPSGIPLAYGSYQSLFINPNPNGGPSITLPSSGFLQEQGKYNNYTLEFWMRLINKNVKPIRIVGPINSTDGLYIENNFLTFYLGPYSQSYFIGKWYRPMIIHIEYSPTLINILVNGEKVISIDINVDKIPFASGNSFIGIYGSKLFENFEIDSIAIYPYTMPTETAKKHFVYGQGVQEFDFSNEKIQKKTIQIDFPYSEYSYNVIYPDTVTWRNGSSTNIDTSSSYIKPSTYSLPQIIAQSDQSFVDTDKWLFDNYQKNISDPEMSEYFKITPTPYYSQASIYFKNLNIIGSRIKAIFGVFKSPDSAIINQEIMSFDNKQTGESFKIILNNNTLQYKFYDQNGTSTNLNLNQTIYNNSYFYAGIDIEKISEIFYDKIGIFFSDHSKLSLSIGGKTNSTFSGKIFGLNFIDSLYFEKDFASTNRFDNGSISQDNDLPTLIKYYGNYCLIPIFSNTSMKMDVATSGFWEDCLPLSMFGKNIITDNGTLYDLDLIQFNIDVEYEKIQLSFQDVNYAFINTIFENMTYEEINQLYSSYNDILENVFSIYQNFVSITDVKTYIAFQQYNEIGQKQYSDYINISTFPNNRVIEIDPLTISNTKYEINNNSCILIPKTINFMNFYICLFIEINIRGTHTKNTVIRRCELSSFSFNDLGLTKIGTKYSIPIYPFSEAII